MARFFSRGSKDKPAQPKKQGKIAQLLAIFKMTRAVDKALVWWMLLAFAGTVLVGVLLGLLVVGPLQLGLIFAPLGFMLALIVMARRAESAAFSQIAGQPGATAAALQNLRRGWNVEEKPVAIDPRTQDMVFRAVGRPGVVLVTEGPLPRVAKLADQQAKHIKRVLGDGVPVIVLNAGDGEGQVPLIKLSRVLTRKRAFLTKHQVSEVSKRLRALGGVKMPVPKGIDPTRMRPDRRAMRGR
jgi:F0F1-type ATP synthase assembly protein I